MSFGVVSSIDLISVFAFACALFFALKIPHNTLDRDSRLFISLCFVIYCFIGISNVLEHGQITDYFDRYEDYFELLFIPFFLYFVYSVRMQSELKERQQSEEKFRSLAEQSPNMIFINKMGRIVYVNQACEQTMGYTVEEFFSPEFDFLTLIAPESVEITKQSFDKHNKGEEVIPYEYTLIAGDGRKVEAIITTKLITYDGGKAILGIITDITERKRMEMILQTQRDLGVVLSSTSDLNEALTRMLETALKKEGIDCGGIYILDHPTGNLNLIVHKGLSPAFVEAVSCYDADSPNTRMVMAGKPIFQRYQEIAPVMDKPHQDEGLRAMAVIPVKHKNQVIAVFNLASHDFDEIPQSTCDILEVIAAFIGSAIARIRAEEALRQAKEELERQNEELKALDKLKDGIIRDVTHELKTPVAKQNMQLDILSRITKKHGLGGECARIIQIMESSIKRQESVIRNMLDLARLEAGGQKYHEEPVRLDQVIEIVLKDYQSTIEMHGIIVETDLFPVTIQSDEGMLFHVFSNIINNAIKFRHKSEVTRLDIALVKKEKEIIIVVQDNGIGLTAEQQQQVFERFYQATASVEGSGVGLNITRKIINDLGGSIWLESPGLQQGTAVHVQFPLERGGAA